MQVIQEETQHPSPEVAEGSRTGALNTGILISLANFGGLVLLDLILQPASDAPRIYSHWAIMLGTSIFLPASIAGGYLIRAQLPPSKAGRMAGLVVGTLAGVAMLFSQLIWIIDSNPQATWKLEEAHRYSTMGWYNLVVSVAIFAIGGYFLGDAQGRLHRARWKGLDIRSGASFRNRATWLNLIGLVGYGLTVIADNLAYTESASSRAALFLIILLFVVGAVIVWLLRGDDRPLHAE